MNRWAIFARPCRDFLQAKIAKALAPGGKGKVFCPDCGKPILLRDVVEEKFDSPTVPPGRFSTDPVHIHSRKRAAIENGLDWLLDRVRLLGPHAGTWAEAMMQQRGPQGLRVLQGFLQLAAKHTPANVAAASQLATTHGVWHLRELKHLLQAPPGQDQFQFVQAHPLIRDLSHYQALVPDCFTPQP
mgnify:CR=1 FL=1